MPNHVTNKLTINGTPKEINEVMAFIQVEPTEKKDEISGIGTIDFHKITPMPKWVYGSDPSVKGISIEDEKKYGIENTVLAWSKKNWGTKWGAYGLGDSRNTANTIYFDTAWNGVPELMQKLAFIFPSVLLEYSFADEDFGRNVAEYHFQGTTILHQHVPIGGSTEAYNLALKVKQEIPDWLVYNDETNTYDHVDI